MQLKRENFVTLKKFIHFTLFNLQRKRILDHKFCICSAQISLTYLSPIKSLKVKLMMQIRACSSVLKSLAMEKSFVSGSRTPYQYHKRFTVNLENLLASTPIWAWLLLADIPFSTHLTHVTFSISKSFQSTLS